MLKSWQSHQEYKAFLHEAKVHFGPSLRHRLFSFSDIRAKLISLNLDPVMEFISSLYSDGGRPAENQAQKAKRNACLFRLRRGVRKPSMQRVLCR